MAKNYTITFKSLRAATVYTLSIGGGTGTAVPLKGGAEPFTTQEDENDDIFTPVRTQSGYFRIVDDGKDANGNAFDWKDLIPATDTSRPVVLTDGGGNVMWKGFMQAQNFGGTLYGNPQEREFPVQCCLSVLNAKQVSTTEGALNNFAYLLQTTLVTNMPGTAFASFVIQGGADARQWLLKKFDWNNFLKETEDSDAEPRYSHFQVIEDMCKFWGWTIRTHRNVVYLTAMDDSAEQTLLTLTPTQLNQLATESDTSAGTVSNVGAATTLSGDIFASTNNDTYQNRGPNKATVKATVNENETVVKVFPPSVEKDLETQGWTWHQEQGEDLVGYFETNKHKSSFDTAKLAGQRNNNSCYFACRQIYTSKESDTVESVDMMVFKNISGASAPYFSLQTKKAMAFAGGSLSLGGTIYTGSRATSWSERTRLKMRVGIGLTRASARWFYFEQTQAGVENWISGWSTQGTVKDFWAGVQGGSINGCALVYWYVSNWEVYYYKSIPIPNEANLYGYLFIDIGDFYSNDVASDGFEIADFSVEFSRDSIALPTPGNTFRPRSLKIDRVNMKEYTSDNQNSTGVEWNADCIFASDNNMTYGYGLIMNANGTFMETAGYNGASEHPEQHLANRVTDFWTASKRRLKVDLRSNEITEPTPVNKLTIDSTTGQPIAISHDWRDDITTITILEL